MISAPTWIAALRGSHEQLASLVTPLAPDQLTDGAYPSEWTIAQVLSHIGSGSEIFTLILNAARTGGPTPGREQMAPIWDIWNAKSPKEQAGDAIPANQALVELFEELAAEPAAADLRITFIGRELDLAGLAGMRLSEHALHTWDVAVALDPGAVLAPAAATLLIDTAGATAAWTGKPVGGPARIWVSTTGPAREFVLTLDDAVSVAPFTGDDAAGKPTAELHLPAESLIRLFAGRLDPDHTPAAVTATGVELDVLR